MFNPKRCILLRNIASFIDIFVFEQTDYIENQINKIRDYVEERQSRIAWQTVQKVSRRNSTTKDKLKATRQEKRIQLRKKHSENLLGSPEPNTRIV